MLKLTRALGLLHFAATLSLTLALAPAQAGTAMFAIDPQDLPGALKAFAVQSHREIFFAPELARGRQSKGVKGQFDDLKALNIILEGTGLNYSVTPSDAILVRDPADKSTSQPAPTVPGDADSTKEAGKKSSQDFRVAQLDQGSAQSTSTVGNNRNPTNEQNNGPALTEIIVTAQKRSERLQDVPVPVSVISAQSLEDYNQMRLQDYYGKLPGLSLTPAGDGSGANLSIRGISSGGYTNPTVGVVVDGVPYGSSTLQGGGYAAPDIDPSDLANVEVLRGPQGTLYGADSIGGLIKFTTLDPSTTALTGRVQVGGNSVFNGNGLGYNVRGAVNIPLSDTVAVRASAFKSQDPGYIDDPASGARGVNERHSEGGRLAALWRPSGDFSIKLSALVQHLTANGSSNVFALPTLKDLQHTELPGTGGYDKTFQSYSAEVAGGIGSVSLTSISAYSINHVETNIDVTPFYGVGFTQPDFGVIGTPAFADLRTGKFTQELRASGPIGDRVEWLLGGFYTHEDTSSVQDINAADQNTGAVVGTGFYFISPTPFSEIAAFTDFTFHFTDRFNIQVGGRESQNKQTYSAITTGQFVSQFYPGTTSPLIQPRVDSKGNAFTYLVTPQFKMTADLMVYARLASGYRPGGPNTNAAALNKLGLPSEFKADKTNNYEIGFKGDTLNHKFSFDASLYYINWKDIQLQLTDPATSTGYYANASSAKSQGLELSVESRPATGLKVAAWISLNDAKLTEGFPLGTNAVGTAGDRLPYSSRVSGNISVDQEVALARGVTGFAGAGMSYVGNREGNFSPSYFVPPMRQYFPGFAQIDVRTGAKWSSWSANVFVTNIADKRGAIGGGLDSVLSLPYILNYIQPRTVGIAIADTF